MPLPTPEMTPIDRQLWTLSERKNAIHLPPETKTYFIVPRKVQFVEGNCELRAEKKKTRCGGKKGRPHVSDANPIGTVHSGECDGDRSVEMKKDGGTLESRLMGLNRVCRKIYLEQQAVRAI